MILGRSREVIDIFHCDIGQVHNRNDKMVTHLTNTLTELYEREREATRGNDVLVTILTETTNRLF